MNSAKKIFKFFPKLSFAPAGDRVSMSRLKHHHNKHFSGPISSPMIPPEARRRTEDFGAHEPTSPEVSCMGQIKHKNKKKKVRRCRSGIGRIFGPRRETDGPSNCSNRKPPAVEAPPKIGQMKKFATSRESLASFDWTTVQVAPEGDDDVVIPFSAPILGDEGVGAGGSAPETKRDTNLWKRRTIVRPKPLQCDRMNKRVEN